MYAKKSILALILARAGSKGLPGKNIRPLLGKPLIAWSIEAAKDSEFVDRVVVSTDSEEIASIAKTYGAEVPFLRPAQLAADDSPSIDAIVHAIDQLESEGYHYDYLALLEPTSPLRDSSDVDAAIKQLILNGESESIVGVAKAESTHPIFLSRITDERLSPYLSSDFTARRRQEIDDCYYFEGTIYVSKVDALREHRGFYHEKTLGYVVPKWKSYEIDDLIDFVIIEALARARMEGRIDDSGYRG